MDIFSRYLFFVFITSVAMGAFAQSGKFCLLGGIRAYVNKTNQHRIWVYLVAIAIALIGANLLEYSAAINLNNTSPAYRSENFAYGRYMIGGFVFGFAMVLASGCGMRQLVKMGQGSLNALLVVLVMAISVYMMLKTSLYADVFMPILTPLSVDLSQLGSAEIAQQDLASTLVGESENKPIYRLLIALQIAFPIIYFSSKNSVFRQPRYFLGALGVGLAIVLGFYITGGEFGQLLIEEAEFMEDVPRGLATQSYSFAAPLSDAVYAVLYNEGWSVITFGVVAVIGVPIGAFVSSLFRGEFRFSGFEFDKKLFAKMIGGVLAGIGSVLAMGCSVGHGLTGISTLALGSFVALAFIILGALVGLKLESLRGSRSTS